MFLKHIFLQPGKNIYNAYLGTELTPLAYKELLWINVERWVEKWAQDMTR